MTEKKYQQGLEKLITNDVEEIERNIEEVTKNIPDSSFQASPEKLEKLLQSKKIKRNIIRESLEESQKESKKDSINEQKVEKWNIVEQIEECNKQTSRKKTSKNEIWKRRVIKWTAYAAVTAFGIFGVSMSSEANRAYIMQEVDRLFGNKISTEIDNNEVLKSDRTEDYVNKNIEDMLELKMPQFYYFPDKLQYQDYTVDEEAKTAIIQYLYEEQIVYLMICSNTKSSTGLVQNDIGKKTDEISSELAVGVVVSLWNIMEDGDELPTYSLRWIYKNGYYELLGKIPEKEMINIAKKIMY